MGPRLRYRFFVKTSNASSMAGPANRPLTPAETPSSTRPGPPAKAQGGGLGDGKANAVTERQGGSTVHLTGAFEASPPDGRAPSGRLSLGSLGGAGVNRAAPPSAACLPSASSCAEAGAGRGWGW